MKRYWPILMPSLILFLRTWVFIVLLTSIEEANGTENTHVKVSVSQESLRQVPSCIPEISWVELVNTHPTNSIEILGIDTIEMDVPNNQQHRFFEINQDGFPLSLSPGQTEYKPLIFLPRDTESVTTTTPEDKLENINKNQIIAHNAIVRVITSEGTVYSPFKALSVLSNPYGLRAGLHFQGKLRNIVRKQPGKYNGLEVNEMRWEYDIFLRNPSDSNLLVLEIFSSEPDWIKYQILDELADEYYGPFEILPKESMYVGTVVVHSSDAISAINNKHDRDDYINDSILLGGYLHIRTNLDELIMPIDVTLTGVVVAIEAVKSKARKEMIASMDHKEATIKIQTKDEDNKNVSETIEETGVIEDDKPSVNETSEQNILNHTEFTITYNQEDFYFPTILSVFDTDRNTAKEEHKGKQHGFNLFPNAFRRKSIQSETSNENIEHVISFANNCSVPLTLLSLELSSSECSQWFELRNQNFFEGLNADPDESWRIPGRNMSLIYFGNFTYSSPTPFKSCSLLLRTHLFTHEIPITLYGNEILITAETNTLPPLCQISFDRHKDNFMDIRDCSAQWWDSSSMRSEVKSSLSHDTGSHPLTLNFGAITAGEVSVKSLMFTNPNPIPVKVLSDKSSLQGMEISLGRTSARVADYIPASERQFWNHPFFPELGWKNDIKFSAYADENLRESFLKHGKIELFREANRPSLNFYSTYNETRTLINQDGGVLLSLDGQYQKQLYLSSNQQSQTWSIPPGAVARFDVYVHAPPKEVLTKDVTSFVASGIVLETATTTLDLLITFDTLLGKLEMFPKDERIAIDSQVTKTHDSRKLLFDRSKRTLHIPAYYRPYDVSTTDQKLLLDPNGVELVVSSTFSNDLTLHDLESCNKWFSVASNKLHNDDTISIRAREHLLSIGNIFSTISCKRNNFYSCAVEWLENASSIQPLGCGLDNKMNEIDESLGLFVKETKESVLLTLKAAENHVSSLYSIDTNDVKSAKLYHDGQVSPISQDSITNIDRANEAWYQISALNLNRISTEISAKTSQGNRLNRTTPTSLPILFADTELLLPTLNTLINSTLDFTVNSISSYSSKYITVSNPTALPIRVGIVSLETPDIFVQYSADQTHPWWTANSYWMPDGKGNVLQSNHNLTIQNAGGTFVTLVNPSLNSKSSFISGCGKRCGLRNEANGADYEYTLIGASAAHGSSTAPYSDYSAPFALSSRGLSEAEIPAFGKAKLGPVYFRPAQRIEYISELFLQNSLTGLERILIKGRGGLEKVVLLHKDVEQRIGRPTLVFTGKGEVNKIFSEKDLFLTNLGDIAVEIRKIYITTSEIINYATMKRLSRSDLYNVDLDENPYNCEEHGFKLIGCITNNQRKDNDSSLFPDLKHGLILEPGQNRTISVQHTPDCTFGTVYVSLNIEYRTHDLSHDNVDDINVKKIDLLMGYDHNPNDLLKCRSSPNLVVVNMPGKMQTLVQLSVFTLCFLYILVILNTFIFRYQHACKFREKSTKSIKNLMYPISGKTTGSDMNTWVSHFHCLTQSDPTSQDLIALGREQSKRNLLLWYRKRNVSTELSQCVQFETESGRETGYRATNVSVGHTKKVSSLSEVIYGMYDGQKPNEFIPGGLGWRFRGKESLIPSLKSLDCLMDETEMDGVCNVRDLITRRKAKGILNSQYENDASKKKTLENHNDHHSHKTSKETRKNDTSHSNQGPVSIPIPIKPTKVDTNVSNDSNPTTLGPADRKERMRKTNANATEVAEENNDDILISTNHSKEHNSAGTKDVKISFKKERMDMQADQSQPPTRKKTHDSSRKSQKVQVQPKPATKSKYSARNNQIDQNCKIHKGNITSPKTPSSKVSRVDKGDHGIKCPTPNHSSNRPESQSNHDVKHQHSSKSPTKNPAFPKKDRSDKSNPINVPNSPIPIITNNRAGKQKSSLHSNKKVQNGHDASKNIKRSDDGPIKNSAPDLRDVELLLPSHFDTKEEKPVTLEQLSPVTSEISEKIPSRATSPSSLRPPPGLLPPPGFTSESNASDKNNWLMLESASNEFTSKVDVSGSNVEKSSDEPQSPLYTAENLYQFNQPLIGSTQNSFLTRNPTLISPNDLSQNKNAVPAIGSERVNMGSELRMSSNNDGFESMQSNMTQLGFGGGFNIDNYLSDILNESSVSQGEVTSGGNEIAAIGDTLPIGRTLPPSNPWEASISDPLNSITEKKYEESRAIAYGIDVEKSFVLENSPANLSHNHTNNVPDNINGSFLDTKDDSDQLDDIVYLNAEVAGNDELDENNNDNMDEDFLDGDSFIMSLVGE